MSGPVVKRPLLGSWAIVLLTCLLADGGSAAAEETWELARVIGEGGRNPGQLANPWDVTLDAEGNIYVVDFGNSRVQVLTSSGAYLRHWGERGPAHGQFLGPRAIALDEGSVYVVESEGCRVQRFTIEGLYLSSWGRCDGPLNLQSADGIDVENGIAYVTNYIWVLKYDGETGTLLHHFSATYASDVHLAPDGTLWVAFADLQLVRHYSPDGEQLAMWSTVAPGEQYSLPTHIAVDAGGQVFVSDIGGPTWEVKKFTPEGEIVARIPMGWYPPWGAFFPQGLEVVGEDTLYVASEFPARILAFRRVPVSVEAGTWGQIKARYGH